MNRIANESLSDILNHYQAFLNRLGGPENAGGAADASKLPSRTVYQKATKPKSRRRVPGAYNYMYDGNSEEWHPLDKKDAIDPKFQQFLTNHKGSSSTKVFAKKPYFAKSSKTSSSKSTVYGESKIEPKLKEPLNVIVQNTRTSPVEVITARPYVKSTNSYSSISSSSGSSQRYRRPVVPSKELPAQNPLVKEQANYQKQYMQRYGQSSSASSQSSKTSQFPYEYYKA